MERFLKAGGRVCGEFEETDYDAVVDALFGVGLSREITGNYAELLNRMNEESGKKLAVDIPSGIHGDTGAVMGTGFYADLTVTFAFAISYAVIRYSPLMLPVYDPVCAAFTVMRSVVPSGTMSVFPTGFPVSA